MAGLIGVRFIPDAKLTNYLLNVDHPAGGPKALFFIANDFNPDTPDTFATALLLHADTHPIRSELVHPRGVNRLIRGELVTPSGRHPIIDVVWVQDEGVTLQRLVTAYPT